MTDTHYDRRKLFTNSNVSTFEQCPLRFFHEYFKGVSIDGDVEIIDDNKYARWGTIFHELVADYLVQCHISTTTPKELWKKNIDAALVDCSDEDKTAVLDIIQSFEYKYGNPPKPIPSDAEIIGIEMPFYLDAKGELSRKGEAVVAGTIDLLYMTSDGVLVVHDWKTGNNPDFSLPIEQEPQMRLYSYAAAKMVPHVALIQPQLDFVRLDSLYPAEPKQFAREIFTQTTWAWMAARTMPIVEAIRTNKFPANPNEWCANCQVRQQCPAYQKALTRLPEKVQLASHKEALSFLKKVNIAEARLKEFKDEIRKYVERTGPIIDEKAGKAYKLCPNPQYGADIKDVVAMLKGLGISGADITAEMSISKGKAESIVKKHTQAKSDERKAGTEKIAKLFKKSFGNPKLQWVKE